MKRVSIIMCILMSLILIGCSNTQDYKNDCKNFLFDYFEDSQMCVLYYNIEEFESTNMHVSELQQKFDNGIVYKFTIYEQSGGNELEKLYFVGILNGDKVIYEYEDKGQYSNLVKIR